VGLEDLIARRIGKNTIGFGSKVESKKNRKVGEMLEKAEPQDLLKFGMIPEFVGRLPVIATLHELDEEALIDILRKPKNEVVRQYQKLFAMENVKLKFTEDALRAVARQALARKSGARGLRAILEDAMVDIMYEIPSRTDVKEVIINEDVILKKEKPILLFEKAAETA
jgi:ATP-dependent Clp protease ATP-binding subunit ClpX